MNDIAKKMIKQLEERRADLVKRSDASTDITEIRSIYEQLQTINADIDGFKELAADDERTQTVNGDESRSGSPHFVQGVGFKPAEERGGADYSKIFETREKAGLDLKERRAVSAPFGVFGELRAVTIGNGTEIVVPRTFSPTINTDFNAVSSLIDSVAHLSLNGGESFRQPYVTGIDVGNYTDESSETQEAETHFSYVDINKAKVTAYAELTKELFKLPNAAYADAVFQNIRNSMRMLITKEILVGAGNTNQLVGIFSANATAIDSETDLDIKKISNSAVETTMLENDGIYSSAGAGDYVLQSLDPSSLYNQFKSDTKVSAMLAVAIPAYTTGDGVKRLTCRIVDDENVTDYETTRYLPEMTEEEFASLEGAMPLMAKQIPIASDTTFAKIDGLKVGWVTGV